MWRKFVYLVGCRTFDTTLETILYIQRPKNSMGNKFVHPYLQDSKSKTIFILEATLEADYAVLGTTR